MYSFDFAEIEKLQHQNLWDEATHLMVEAAQNLERGGADFIIICSNTMHKMAGAVQEQVKIPLLHLADATAEQIVAAKMKRIGLLGTIYTMEQDFYRGRLAEKYGLEVVVPEADERQFVSDVIYQELVLGKVNPASRQRYREIIAHLVEQGVEGIILGCTEIMLLVEQEDSVVPLFDTTTIHAETAVDYALK